MQDFWEMALFADQTFNRFIEGYCHTLWISTNCPTSDLDARLSGKAYKDIMEGMKFGKKAMALIDDHIESEFPGNEAGRLPAMSLWQFYNVVTWYMSHHAASLNHSVELEKRLRRGVKAF